MNWYLFFTGLCTVFNLFCGIVAIKVGRVTDALFMMFATGSMFTCFILEAIDVISELWNLAKEEE